MSEGRDAELRRRVLALVRASRPRARALDLRLQLSLARVACASRSLAAERQAEAAATELQRALGELGGLATCAEGGGRALARMLARRLALEPTLAVARRFREEADALSSAVGRKRARAEATERVVWSEQVPTRKALALADMIVVCAMHNWAIVRVDDLLEAMDGQNTGLQDALTRVLGEEPVLLPVSLGNLVNIGIGERTDELQSDSHELAKWIIGQIASAAFLHEPVEQQDGHQAGRLGSHNALSMLEALCAPSAPTHLHAIQAIASRFQRRPEENKVVGCLHETGTTDIVAFISDNLLSFLAHPISTHSSPKARDGLLECFQLTLTPAAAVQVIRRFLVQDFQPGETSSIVVGASTNIETHSSLQGSVFYFVSRYASDSVEFMNRVLTLAHELAEDAVQCGKTWCFGLALELAATVAASPLASSSCYKDWFQGHFSKEPSSDQPHSEVSCQKWAASKPHNSDCCLIHSKNHLQFVCLFLVEFDRRRQCDDSVVWTAPHVMTHLSVLKSFQGQNSPKNDLVIDFIAQERILYSKLQTKEQAENQSMKKAVPEKANDIFSSDACAVVKENITYYREHQHLSPQLKQWKTFQYKKWKAEILPCCLNVSLNDEVNALDSEDLSSDNPDVVHHIRFVFALAKANMVPAQDYARFTESIQHWIDLTRESISNGMRSNRQRKFESSLNSLINALRNIFQRAEAAKFAIDDNVVSEVIDSVSAEIFAYITSRAGLFEPGYRADEESRRELLTLMWSSGFIEVLNTLGPEHLESFCRYQISLLTKLSLSLTSWPVLSDVCAVALSHQHPDCGNTIERMIAFAGVVAVMCSAIDRTATPVLDEALAHFNFIDKTPSGGIWPTQERVIQGSIHLSTLLLALNIVDNNASNHSVAQNTLPSHLLDFGAWWISNFLGEDDDCTRIAGKDRGRYSYWLICLHRSLRQTGWLAWSQQRLKSLETVKNALCFEARYRWIFKDNLRTEENTREKRPLTSRLSQYINLIDCVSQRLQPQEWCQLLLEEMFSTATSSADKANSKPLSVEIEKSLEFLLLLLNSLIHRMDNSSASTSPENKLPYTCLKLTIDKLTMLHGRNADMISRVYWVCAETLRTLCLHKVAGTQLSQLHTVDTNPLLDLFRLVSADLKAHSLLVVGRGIVEQLFDLVKKQCVEDFWGISVTDLPIPLVVEWSLKHKQSHGLQNPAGDTASVKLFNLVDWIGRFSEAMNAAWLSSSSAGLCHGTLDTYNVFGSSLDALKYLIKVTHYLLDGKNYTVHPIDRIRQITSLRRMVELTLDYCACRESETPSFSLCIPQNNKYGVTNLPMHNGIQWLAREWDEETARDQRNYSTTKTNVTTADSMYYQRFIQLTVVALCARSAQGSNNLLDLLDTDLPKHGMFAVFVTSTAHEAGQLEEIISHSSSRWVNAFLLAALNVIGHRKVGQQAMLRRSALDSVLAGSISFRARVKFLVLRILQYGCERRMKLDSTLQRQLIAQWPDIEAQPLLT